MAQLPARCSWSRLGATIGFIALGACQSRAPVHVVMEKAPVAGILSVNPHIDTVDATSVPTVVLPAPRRTAKDSFRIASGIAGASSSVFVLDRGRAPHVSEVDGVSQNTVRRLIPHLDATGDTIFPVAIGLRERSEGSEVLLLDNRRKRLVGSTPDGVGTGLRYYDLHPVLGPSDNPTALAVTPWGVSVTGTLTRGTRFAYSSDVRRWTVWRDTTAVSSGLPLDSFMRGIADASIIAMHPTRRLLMLPAMYHRALGIVDLETGVLRRVVFGESDSAPARLRLAEDSSVRIVWSNDATLHFVAAAPARSFVALVDCSCRSSQPDSTAERRQIWLLGWNGAPLMRLLSPMRVMSAFISADEQTLIATVRDGGWERLVEWSLPHVTAALAGRGRGSSFALGQP